MKRETRRDIESVREREGEREINKVVREFEGGEKKKKERYGMTEWKRKRKRKGIKRERREEKGKRYNEREK
jgi:hypothetical protein